MTHDNTAYLLQCVRLGMLLATPDELDMVEPWHFGDPVIRDVVNELKERRRTVKEGGKLTNGPTLLSTLLMEWGCEESNSVEHARVAIQDRVECEGMFVRALGFLDSMIQVKVENRNLSNYELRRFAEAVFSGMNPR